jgi:4-aminobutyrate aminotransferase / (S)-3-amino-2-methylpropionate transaminase / 5-aminovalerate transaminase
VKDHTLKTPAPDETLLLTQECLKRGLIAIRAGLYSNCIRYLPPLNLSLDEVDEGMAIMAEALRIVEGSRRSVTA